MKTRILILAAILSIATSICFGTVLTVSNHPLGGAQYNSLQTAFDATVDGDTLLIEGTDIDYYLNGWPPKRWSKQLTVIGAGFNTNKQNFKKTRIRNADYLSTFLINSSGSGSSFYGITFLSVVDFEGAISNLTFADCLFMAEFNFNNNYVSNLIFRNCIFNRDNLHNIALSNTQSSTVSILNCVFDGYIEGYNNPLNTLIVDHCLFLSTSAGHFSQLQNASINNCIFMNLFPGGTTNSNYLNNICRVSGTLPPGGNTGSGNISNTDPLLTSYTFGSLYNSAHDYDLQAGSPGINAGSDGTDIGVHGGYSNFSENGEPLIVPVVRSVTINNTTVTPNGTLDVDVSASKPADE